MTRAGFPHSDTPGSQLGCQLPRAYRRLQRPSSALDAKASTMCPSKLVSTTSQQHTPPSQHSNNTTSPPDNHRQTSLQSHIHSHSHTPHTPPATHTPPAITDQHHARHPGKHAAHDRCSRPLCRSQTTTPPTPATPLTQDLGRRETSRSPNPRTRASPGPVRLIPQDPTVCSTIPRPVPGS